MMTLETLRDALDSLIAEYGPDVPVRIAEQPAWPLEYDITDGGLMIVDPDDDTSDEHVDDEHVDEPVAYIVQGTQLGYLPSRVARELSW